MNVTSAVEHRSILPLHPKLLVNVQTRHRCRACTAHHNANVFDAFVGEFERIDQGRGTDDGRAVLVVVHQRNVEFFLQSPLDFKGLRGLDVFEVDATKRGRNGLHGGHKMIDVGGVHLNVEHVDVCEHLEQNALSLHDRLAGFRANVAEPKHCRAVADDGHQVPLGRVLVDILWLVRNGLARLRHAWTVRQAQVTLCAVGFGGDNLDFAPSLSSVVLEGFPLQIVGLHGSTKFNTKVDGNTPSPAKLAHHVVHNV